MCYIFVLKLFKTGSEVVPQLYYMWDKFVLQLHTSCMVIRQLVVRTKVRLYCTKMYPSAHIYSHTFTDANNTIIS